MLGKKIHFAILISLLMANTSVGWGQELRGQKAHLNPDVVTFWHKLGLPQGVARTKLLKDSLVNRKGLKPEKERKPKLKRLADPANLAPEMPEAIKVAAAMKIDQDLAPQKIKALKYICSIGCSCYDKQTEGLVTAALMEAMKDCTVEVRLTAIQCVLANAGSRCSCQGQCETCCSPKLLKLLKDIAYKQDEKTGCYFEANAQVRSLAEQALTACPPAPEPEPEDKVEKEPVPEKDPDLIDKGTGDAKDADPNIGDKGEDDDSTVEEIIEEAEDDDVDLKIEIDSDDPPQPDTDDETTQRTSRRTLKQVSSRSSHGSAWNDPALSELAVRGIVNSIQHDRSNVLIELVKPFEFPVGWELVIASDEDRVSFGTIVSSQPGKALIKVDDYSVIQQLSKSQRVRVGILDQVGN